MKISPDSLPNGIDLLKQLLLETLADKDAGIAELKQSVLRLLEQFRQAQQQRFGASSESHHYQGELFNEVEVLLDEPAEFPTDDKPASLRKRAKRQPLPKSLPREIIIHDISDEDKECDCCGHQLALMGQDSIEKLQFVPAQINVIEHVRLKYSCKQCETTGTHANIKQAPVPRPPLAQSPKVLQRLVYLANLSPVNISMPYRFNGIALSRQTMADWMMKSAALFKPLYDLLHQHLLKHRVLHADETTLKVLTMSE